MKEKTENTSFVSRESQQVQKDQQEGDRNAIPVYIRLYENGFKQSKLANFDFYDFFDQKSNPTVDFQGRNYQIKLKVTKGGQFLSDKEYEGWCIFMTSGYILLIDLSSDDIVSRVKKEFRESNFHLQDHIRERLFIVGDVGNLKEGIERAISFEEAQIVFQGFTYMEIDAKIGFNMAQLQCKILERLHDIALRKQNNYLREQKRNHKSNLMINWTLTLFTQLLLFVVFMSFYSMFMWAGIKLTDFVLKTDKWYQQTLSFAYGLIFSIFQFFIFFFVPAHLQKQKPGITILLPTLNGKCEIKQILYASIKIANQAFYFYTLHFVIHYISVFQNTRDILVISAGVILVVSFIWVESISQMRSNKRRGFYDKYFPCGKERLPVCY